ncbi:unnamed protein product [Acidithrix sp. C25]|nr:unnamed protein product [Acidithrix sp. C25]
MSSNTVRPLSIGVVRRHFEFLHTTEFQTGQWESGGIDVANAIAITTP